MHLLASEHGARVVKRAVIAVACFLAFAAASAILLPTSAMAGESQQETATVAFTDDMTSWSYYLEVPVGSRIGKLPGYSNRNYKLLGWYTKKNGGTKVSSSTIVNGYMLLHARLKGLPVTVEFKGNGGKITKGKAKRTGIQGKALGTLPTAARSGYLFLGWYSGEPNSGYWSHHKTTSKDPVNGDQNRVDTYTARWVKKGKGSTVTLAEWSRFKEVYDLGVRLSFKQVCSVFGGKGKLGGVINSCPAYTWCGPSSYGYSGYNSVTLAFADDKFSGRVIATPPFKW